MKQADEAIERVLAGLRAIEPPVGMERRILEAAEARAAEKSVWGWRLPLACGVALAGMALALSAMRPTKLAVDPAKTAAKQPLPRVVPQPGVGPVKLVAPRRTPAKATQRVVAGLDAEAWSDVHAPSFPAPPMPLTEQEKLLVAVAERGQPQPMPVLDAKPLPVLDPDGLAQQEAQQETHFQQQLVAQSADVEQWIETMQRKGERR